MKKVNKEKIIGFTGSAIFLLLLFLLLTHLYLQANIQQKESEVLLYSGGIELHQGEVDWQEGTFIPQDNIPIETDIQDGEINPDIPSVITDNTDASVAMEAERRRKEQEERQEAERRRQNELNNRAANLFGAGSSGAGQGSSSGGNQGTGSSGSGGYGSFDLGGRGLYPGSALPRPAYTVQEEGTIVIEVTVDPKGNVIDGRVRARGTNITNESMRRSAIEAARKAKFAVIHGADNQHGTITYRYKLN